MSNENYITTTQAAQQLGVTKPTICRWDKQGILKPALRTPGGRRLYTQSQINDFIEHMKEKQDE